MKIQRWRITFSKKDEMRYTGHLDLILTWERTFRRSGLALSYSEGFNPRPVIVLAAPLPLGFTSTGEIGDFWLSESVSKKDFLENLRVALPPGLAIQDAVEIQDMHGGKLPALVQSAVYVIELPGYQDGLDEKIALLLAKDHAPMLRKGKTYDLRPLILSLSLESSQPAGIQLLRSRLSLLPGASGRPDEVLKAMGISPEKSRISRERIVLKDAPNPS